MSNEQWKLIRELRLMVARRAQLLADQDDGTISDEDAGELEDIESETCEKVHDLLETFGGLPEAFG